MRFAPACWLAAAALLLAGCGGKKQGTPSNGIASLTPAQALAEVRKAVAGAHSVHVVGSGTSSGSPLTLDLRLVAGQGGAGHISIRGLTFDIVRIGSKAYVKGGPGFWRRFGGGAVARLVGSRWLALPATTGQLASLAPMTNLVELTNGILSSHGTLTMGGETTIDGQPAVAIVDGANEGTLYVATTGAAYPLELAAGKGKSGKIEFTEWDQPVLLSPPAKPVDYNRLAGG